MFERMVVIITRVWWSEVDGMIIIIRTMMKVNLATVVIKFIDNNNGDSDGE